MMFAYYHSFIIYFYKIASEQCIRFNLNVYLTICDARKVVTLDVQSVFKIDQPAGKHQKGGRQRRSSETPFERLFASGPIVD